MRLIAIIVLIASAATAQTTHERYILIQPEPGASTSNVWRLAWSDRTNDTRWWTWANERGLTNAALTALPCLVDAESWEAVQVTGTVNQAKADLQAQDDVRRPARKALLDYLAGRTRKQARTQLRDSINAAAGTANATVTDDPDYAVPIGIGGNNANGSSGAIFLYVKPR